ncbi:MAG: sigma-70 family RNA polymerase sigma factor [Candidatus Acidiferrum sp.]
MEFFKFDKDYIERLRAGDAATELHFVGYFAEYFRILLRAKMLSPDKVDDVTQETFQRVLVKVRSEGAIHQPERFGAYVNSICRNALYELQRGGKRIDPIEDAHYEVPDRAPDPHALLVSQESRIMVRRVLASLPAKDRDLLRELFFLEKDKEEICRQHGVDREYLRVLVHRAKSRFREEYEAQASQ